MKLRCLGGSDPAPDLMERQRRQTLIHIFTLMWTWEQTQQHGAHRCAQMIRISFPRWMNQKGICL